MFNELEREYQKGLSERRFWNYYGIRAAGIVVIATVCTLVFNVNSWIIAVLTALMLFIFVGRFFSIDMQRVIGHKKIPRSYLARLQAYAVADQELRIANLLKSLKRNHLIQKDDLRLAIAFFEHNRPVTTKTGLLEWILSIAVTLASVVAIAYDDNLHAIDMTKLLGILLPSVRIALSILVPVLAIGFISNRIFFSKSKIDTILIEDLAFIYVNYDRFAIELK